MVAELQPTSESRQLDIVRPPLITNPQEVGRYFLELIDNMEVAGDTVGEGPYSHIKDQLNERIIGQEEAIESLVNTLNHEEFRDPDKPIGSFMFLGPTGVGKSQTAKEIARLLHGGSDKGFLNINCTQFKMEGDVHVLQGAPPAYIGHDKKTKLNTDVVKEPRSVILFDEVEKAHPALHDFLMQVMDEGETLIFDTGEKLSFRDSIIIMTSNVGSRDMQQYASKTAVGFDHTHNNEPGSIPKSKLAEIAFNALDVTFRPEFLGRIENKVLFTNLTDEQLSLALEQYIRNMNARDGYKKRGIHFEVIPELKSQIVESCTRRHVGGFREVASSFRQTVERDLENRVSNGSIPDNSLVYAIPASDLTKQKNPDAIAEFRFKRFSA